jgi:AcrR family transcriptional regulator
MTQVAETRAAFLRAGVRLYQARAGESLKVLTAGAVAEEAGFHRQTFYRYWTTQSDYVADLILWLLGNERAPSMDGAVVLAEAGADLEGFVRDLPVHDIAHVLDDEQVRMRIGLALLQAINPTTGQGRGEAYYRSTMKRLTEAYETLLVSWGRELAPGYTIVDLVRAMQALGTGFALQSLAMADGRLSGVAAARRAVAAVIEGMTQPVKDR